MVTIADPPKLSGGQEDVGLRPLLEQLRAIWARRMLVIAVASATIAVVALWTIRQPKIYSAMVNIEFDPNPPRPLGREVEEVTSDTNTWWSSHEYYATQNQVIRSERVAEAVIRQLGLQHDADFLGVPGRDRSRFRSVSVLDAAAILRGRTSVEQLRDSRIVSIVVEDTSPRRAQLIANTIAAVYIRQNLEQKLSTTTSALEWLDQQLETLRTQLDASEMALHDYRQRNNLLSVSFEDRSNHIVNRIGSLSTALTETQTQRMRIAARVTEIRRAVATHDPLDQRAPELLQSPMLIQLRETYEETRREREGLATRYGPHAQQMEVLDQRLAEVADAIRSEMRNILGGAEAELRQTQRVESDLSSALRSAQQDALELNLREIQYGRLHRERENNAKLYGLVLERTTQTDLTRMLRVNNIRLLDEALLPRSPVKPRLWLNISVGVMLGLLLGIAAAIVVINADRTMRSQHDVEDLGLPFLGMLPRVQTGRMLGRYSYRSTYSGAAYGDDAANQKPIDNVDLVVHTHPTSAISEAFRVIRTNLTFMSPDKPFQILMVTSADPREGKTTLAVSLAITFAQSGKRTLIVDADLRRPRIHKALGLNSPVGLTTVLVNETSLDEAILATAIPNMSALVCGVIPPNPSELLHSQSFQKALEGMRERFDRVVIDSPPIGPVTDALVLGSQVDGTVVVVRARQTPRARAAVILSQLRVLSIRVVGMVLNDVDLSRGGTESGYYYNEEYAYRTRGRAA